MAAHAKETTLTRRASCSSANCIGVDEPLGRVVDYFKAAAAGSDVGRRLLLLLGPPSGGKSTLAILLKRGLEEYSRTDEGALYAIKGSPLRESPLNLIPTSLRPEFRETYGVDISGEVSPVGAGLFGPRMRRRLPARARRAHFPVGGGPLRHRHLRAARSVDRRYRRSGRIGGLVQGGPRRRRRRSARLVLVRRGIRREPRRARNDRDSEGQTRVSLSAADHDAGKERQGGALSAHLSR